MDGRVASPNKWTESDRRLRRVLRAAMKRSGREYELAQRLSQRLGLPISQKKLDEWTSESKARLRFPFAFAPAFAELTDSFYELARFLLGARFSSLLVDRGQLRELLRALHLQHKDRRKRGRGRG